MAETVLNLASIVTDSIVDGPGIRAVIFAQGCARRCIGCHNPQSWPFGTGADTTLPEIMRIVHTNPLCTGVTFSGGEPFSQAAQFAALAELLHAEGYEVAAYTGYTFEQLCTGESDWLQLLCALDILIDGEYVEAQRDLSLRFRGSRNQRILDVPKSLAKGEAVACTQPRWIGEESHSGPQIAK